MAKRRDKKELNVGKSIGILFLYLVIWWVIITLINMSLTISETSFLYYLLTFLRIAVPIFVVLFGVPMILIIGSNKNVKKKKR